MTASDLPVAGGIPDQGAEGSRFAGYPIYDALFNWDFTHPDKISEPIPGIASAFKVDEEDPRKWVFTIRKGVKFHDGSDVTTDAVLFSFARSFDEKSPAYEPAMAPFNKVSIPMLDRVEKLDDDHIAMWTKYPFSPLPWLLTRPFIVSPTQWEKLGHNWTAYAQAPVGTGPFRVTKIVPHQSMEMVRNADYWDKDRIPKIERMIVYPMPEPTTRLAALRSGQLDWIEVPPPDAIPSLKAAGFQVVLKPYPHTWPWLLSEADGSPLKDKRVRQALNYAIDRQGLVDLLNGTARPAVGLYPPENPAFGHPSEHYGYDPDKAKALLKAAGYGPGHPAKVKVMITPAGSGQMLPLPMNEFIGENLKAVGVDTDFDVVDWGTMLVAVRNQLDAPMTHGDQAMNISLGFSDPSQIYRMFGAKYMAPNGYNWGKYNNPEADALLEKAYAEFDPAKRDALIGEAHAKIVDDAAWLFIVHDLNPRALSPKVKGYVQVQSWYQDFTQLTIAK
jgi:ABC-type transport system substrate-binding protein